MEYYTIDSTFSLIKDIKNYYSQQTSKTGPVIDKLVMDKYINYWKHTSAAKVDGVFVEVGAYDGITYSNTKAMEDNLKWSGILIEPSPTNFEKLSRNRLNTTNISSAISVVDNNVLEFSGDNCAVAGLTHVLDKCVQDTGRCWIDAWNISSSPIEVKIDRLSKIFDDNNIKYVDFLSIDVNGAELEVLETIDWKIPIYIIAIDMSAWGKFGKNVAKKSRELLASKGFIMGDKLDMDEIWVNNNYFRKKILTTIL
jgi:FkbM family methyltransferase